MARNNKGPKNYVALKVLEQFAGRKVDDIEPGELGAAIGQAQNDLAHLRRKHPHLGPKKSKSATTPDAEPDWTGKCENCGESPIVPATGLCGPCTFGEAETAGGNW